MEESKKISQSEQKLTHPVSNKHVNVSSFDYEVSSKNEIQKNRSARKAAKVNYTEIYGNNSITPIQQAKSEF